MAHELNTQIRDFVTAVTDAMGLSTTAKVEDSADGVRVDLEGPGAEQLVRRRGEALGALQHVVMSVFRDELPDGARIAVDCLGFRRGKDQEIRQMALFLAEKAKLSGTPQEMGPLNPYERRLVHMAVAEAQNVTSESVGDAFMKTVIIAARR